MAGHFKIALIFLGCLILTSKPSRKNKESLTCHNSWIDFKNLLAMVDHDSLECRRLKEVTELRQGHLGYKEHAILTRNPPTPLWMDKTDEPTLKAKQLMVDPCKLPAVKTS